MSLARSKGVSNDDRRFIAATMNLPMLERDHESELARRWLRDRDEAALHELTASHARLAVPADEISVPDADPQTSKELRGYDGIDPPTHASLFLQVHQQEQERSPRTLRALSLNRQEVPKSLLVISSARPTLERQAASAPI